MIRVITLTALLMMGTAAMADKLSFDADAIGNPPSGWTVAKTGTGAPKWTVEDDATLGRGLDGPARTQRHLGTADSTGRDVGVHAGQVPPRGGPTGCAG